MASLGYPLGDWLGADNAVVNPTTTNDSAQGILTSLFPPGNLYDFNNPNAEVFKLLAAFGQSIKLFGFDVADRLFVEGNPATAVENLPAWESTLNLVPGQGSVTLGRSTAQRQQGVIGKLRESGASTLNNIRAAVAPLLGYADPSTLVIYEMNRATLTTAHTYTDGGPQLTVPATGSVSRTIRVSDCGKMAGGVALTIVMNGVSWANLTVTLTSANGATKSWTFPQDPGSAVVILRGLSEFAGSEVTDTYTVTLANSNTSPAFWTSASLFVEGVGDGGQGLGNGGLGAEIYYWGIYLDPALANNPDLAAALLALRRMNPAQAAFFVITSLAPWPNATTGAHAAIPGQCIPV